MDSSNSLESEYGLVDMSPENGEIIITQEFMTIEPEYDEFIKIEPEFEPKITQKIITIKAEPVEPEFRVKESLTEVTQKIIIIEAEPEFEPKNTSLDKVTQNTEFKLIDIKSKLIDIKIKNKNKFESWNNDKSCKCLIL